MTYTLNGIEYSPVNGMGIYNVADSLVRDLAGASREELADALREAYIAKAEADEAHADLLDSEIAIIRRVTLDEVETLKAAIETLEGTAKKALEANAVLEERCRTYSLALTKHDALAHTAKDYALNDAPNVIRATFGDNAKRAYKYYCEASQVDESDLPEAERLYRRAITLDPKLAVAWTNLGNVLYRLNREERALECYRKAIEVDADQTEAHFNLGHIAAESSDVAAAEKHLKQAIHTDPRFADAYYTLGVVYVRNNRAKEAKKYLEKFLELEPNSTWAKDVKRMLKRKQ